MFDNFDGRASMEGLLSGSLSTADKRRILSTNPLIEVWIWDHGLDVRFID